MSRTSTPAYTVRRPGINTTPGSSQPSRLGSPSLAGRPVISLEEWESKTQLSDEQLSSITYVKEKLGTRPFPEKVSALILLMYPDA
jgi:hypothetical protein